MKKLICICALVVSALAAAQTPQYLPANGCTTTAGGQLSCSNVAASTMVSAPQHCIGSSCITAWPPAVPTTAVALTSTSLPPAAAYVPHAPSLYYSNLQVANLTGVSSSGLVASGTYTSGITATGSAGQTCTLASFNYSSTATATVALTGTNTIAGGTALVITSAGTGATAAPTSATAGSGTATCSGTAVIATVLTPALSNYGSGKGIVATVSGVAGTATIHFPSTIDSTKPWRLVIHATIYDNASTNVVNVAMIGAQSLYSPRLNFSGNGGYGNNDNGSNGYGGTVPPGTGFSLTIASDGKYVWSCTWPDTISTILQTSTYNGTWVASPFCMEQTVNQVGSGGGLLFYGINGLSISSASTTNTVDAIFLQQGNLDGPNDGKMLAPMWLGPRVRWDTTSVYTASSPRYTPSMIFVPGTYGAPEGSPAVLAHPTNNWLDVPGTAYPTVAALLNDGYIWMTTSATQTQIDDGYVGPDAIASPWGGPSGTAYNKGLVEWVRNNLPSTYQLYQMGMSAGCMASLEYEREQPGNAAIQCVSGVNWIQDPYNGTLPSDVLRGWGDFYVATAASTNQNPATTTGYWKKIATGPTPIPSGYLTNNWTWKNTWSSATAYTQGQIVQVNYAGSTTSLAAYDPHLTTLAPIYVKVPLRNSYCGLDVHYDVVTWPIMKTNVEALGGSVTNVVQTDGTCGDTTADLFDSTAMVAFFDAVRVTAPQATTKFGAPAPSQATAPVWPALGAVGSKPSVTSYQTIAYGVSTWTNITGFSWPLAAYQPFTLDCRIFYQGMNAPSASNIGIQLAGITPIGTVTGDARIQTAISASNVETVQVFGYTGAALPSFIMSPAGIGAISTPYEIRYWASGVNGAAAGVLNLQMEDTGGQGFRVNMGSTCTMIPQ